MQTLNTSSTPALPLQLCVHRYCSRAEDPVFQQLLVIWNQMASILAAAPADTIAKVDSESLFVAPVGGALAMFLSADLSPTAVDGNIFRPGDFDGIGADEFAELQGALERWITAPTYDTPCTPSHLADVLAANYQEPAAPREWKWSGEYENTYGQ
ncbi:MULTISPECIES: hypothetical protein [Pseudomonas]|uniref:Uncharacterized protein n=1 Tax=Pseudomonas oryzihabitans TaxID=47885 RepID=A0A1G5PF55_9PSED|nr:MULTISPECIES: hypothetical protein [Pseudomonas]NMY91776.1 hypothetical protein [Pseudomonas psychrotolerans]NMY92011.1 hypothetical protein [Pseudomonas psychrotolerans]NRH44444.1 hypothetical protein [Pseudomonas sp. MS15a(2019)]SCZ47640.1 hypothetical protein SAMN05216279_11537 [Pseudomonas psychrotolerans]